MRRFALVVLGLVWACEKAPQPRTAADLLCAPTSEPVAYGEFYWDELRRSDLASFKRASELCSRRCPQAVACGPVLTVARWYAESPDAEEVRDPETLSEGSPSPGGGPSEERRP